MDEKKIEEMLGEIGVLVSWLFMGSFFFRARYSNSYMEIMNRVLDFIQCYGSKQDQGLFRKIPDLIKADSAEREDRRKKGISVDMEGDEATKRWVKELLKDIERHL